MTSSPEEQRRLAEEDRAAIERARQESQRIEKTLAKSRRVTREVLPKLRKAGLLR